MQLGKIVVVMTVLAAFVGAPVSRAFAEGRSPASADSKHKHKKKKNGKAKHAKKAKSHKPAKHAKKHSGASSSSSASAGTHYPTQPNSNAGGFDNIPAEKKDDLPPPQTPAN